MPNRPRQRSRDPFRREERRNEFVDAAIKAVRAQGSSVSMEAIAATAGVTKPVLYRYFGDKAALYSAVTNRFITVLRNELSAALTRSDDPRTMIVDAIDAYLSLIERETALYLFLMQHARMETSTQEAIDHFVRLLGDEVAQITRSQLDAAGQDASGAEIWAQGTVGMVNSVGHWWVERKEVPRSEVVRHLSRLLWKGLAGIPLSERA